MIISFTAKCCANCEYWSGPRKPDAFRVHAEVANSTCVPGHCAATGFQKPANGSACLKYRKWALLK